MSDAPDWTLTEIAAAIRAGQVSPVEVARACLDRIDRLDGTLRAFITVDGDRALATARALEADAAAGRWHGPLHGVPLAHKDLCTVPGLPTSGGTKTPDYFTPAPPCTAVARLQAAGAVTLGKLNMTELALGPFGDNAHHGDVQNPWQLGHVSGGSSSGSGAAVAAGLVAGALGTDTGGSIRLPAACCGIAGIKATYGRVSRTGVMALSWSLDHVGPMARTVADVALMLRIVAGHDPLDATSSQRPVPDYVASLAPPVRGLRAGLPDHHFFEGLDPEVEHAVGEAVRVVEGLGVRMKSVRVPDPGALSRLVSTPVVRAECAATHARLLRERPGDMQPVVRARSEPGLSLSAVEYVQALRLRSRATREFLRDVFAEVDVVLTPTIPEPPPAYATAKAGSVDDVIARMGRFSRLTRVFNVFGVPALTVPCGFSGDGRPIGLQIAGRPFDEATVLRVGHAYEQAMPWHRRRPAAG
jgi:aspartyl-tRNA(Asn)/glutamyl-tRNA(Gln) amidotransferase subunit A